MRMLTDLTDGNELMFNTSYGDITYGMWCMREVDRINKTAGYRVAFMKNDPNSNKCCIMTDQERMTVDQLEELGYNIREFVPND